MSEAENLRRINIAKQLQALAQPAMGVIQSYDPATYMVKVAINGETSSLTGWLPVPSQGINGAEVRVGPTIGTQVSLMPLGGDSDCYMIGATFAGSLNPIQDAPAAIGGANEPLASGEILIRSGASCIRITPEGIYMKGNVFIEAPASVVLSTPVVTATGNLSAGTGTTGTFETSTGLVGTVTAGIITNII